MYIVAFDLCYKMLSGQTTVYFMNFSEHVWRGRVESSARNQLGVKSMSDQNTETRSFNSMHSETGPLIINSIECALHLSRQTRNCANAVH